MPRTRSALSDLRSATILGDRVSAPTMTAWKARTVWWFCAEGGEAEEAISAIGGYVREENTWQPIDEGITVGYRFGRLWELWRHVSGTQR